MVLCRTTAYSLTARFVVFGEHWGFRKQPRLGNVFDEVLNKEHLKFWELWYDLVYSADRMEACLVRRKRGVIIGHGTVLYYRPSAGRISMPDISLIQPQQCLQRLSAHVRVFDYDGAGKLSNS